MGTTKSRSYHDGREPRILPLEVSPKSEPMVGVMKPAPVEFVKTSKRVLSKRVFVVDPYPRGRVETPAPANQGESLAIDLVA